MATLKVSNAVITKGLGIAGPITHFELKTPHFGGGNFGKVFACSGPNGTKLLDGLAVKVFVEGPGQPTLLRNIRHLQEALNDYTATAKAGAPAIKDYPALYCLPAISFIGQLGNETVHGYAAHLIPEQRAKSFHDLLDELGNPDVPVKTLRGLPVYQRLRLAQQMVEGMQFLRDRSYIHADLNAHNLLIDVQRGMLHIIDYDAGVVTEKTGDEPETWGKKDEWVAPEVFEQLTPGNDIVKVSLHSDVWSTAVGIHWLLFFTYPYYFLKDLQDSTVKDYQRRYTWPKIDTTDRLFEKAGLPTYKRLNKFYLDHPEVTTAVMRYFTITFQEGYFDRRRRSTYGQWNNAISEVLKFIPPQAYRTPPASKPAPQPRPRATPVKQPRPAPAPAPKPQPSVSPPPPAPPPKPRPAANPSPPSPPPAPPRSPPPRRPAPPAPPRPNPLEALGTIWSNLASFWSTLVRMGEGALRVIWTVVLLFVGAAIVYSVVNKLDHHSVQPAPQAQPPQTNPEGSAEATSEATAEASEAAAAAPSAAEGPQQVPDPADTPASTPVAAADPLATSPAHCRIVKAEWQWGAPGRMQVFVTSQDNGPDGRMQIIVDVGTLNDHYDFDALSAAQYRTELDFDIDTRYAFVPPTAHCMPP